MGGWLDKFLGDLLGGPRKVDKAFARSGELVLETESRLSKEEG